MRRLHWLVLLALGSVSAIVGGWTLRAPGYMDADYYYATARELASGHSLWEPFLWNYLDDPPGIPHPSHLYWMPLASFLAAGSMALLGRGFLQAQIPFLLLTASIPLLTAHLTLRLTESPRAAWHAGLLAAFPGFFLPFFWTTDTFSLYAVLGGVLLITLASAVQNGGAGRWLGAGLLIGLAHLSRADGLLWFLPAMGALFLRREGRGLLPLATGYAMVMCPWMARNLLVAGTLLGPGAGRSLWLLSYDELFSYPASILTPQRWLDSGWPAILSARMQAMGLAAQNLVAVNGLVFLGPLMALGAWEHRRSPMVQLAALFLGGLLLAMVMAFPFAGMHGAFFHSSAALMPVLWALTPDGLGRAVARAAQRRKWDLASARNVFAAASVALAAILTVGLAARRLGGSWQASQETYSRAAEALLRLDPAPGVVAVNNPPGFYLASGIPSVVIPNGPPDVLREVLDRYGAEWVVLDRNHPVGLADLYANPGGVPWLTVQAAVEAEDDSRLWLLHYGAGGQGP